MTRATAEQIEDIATLWVARMDGEHWTADAEAELAAWIAEDPRHDGALLAAQAAWASLDTRSPADVTVRAAPERVPHPERRWLLGGIAAAVVAVVGARFIALNQPTSRFETQVGEIRRIPLADGSTAAMNTASKIRIAFAERERRVAIDEGEVWFQVAKQPERPFIVEAGPVRVRAVGTAFSVRRRSDGADVLVTEGVVEAWSEQAGHGKVRITAGNAAFIPDAAAIAAQPARTIEVDRALAWRSGKIDLVGQPLSAAVAEFNRYNRRQIEIADPRLASEAFDGVFRTNDPAGFATMVGVSLGVPVDTHDPDTIRIGTPRR